MKKTALKPEKLHITICLILTFVMSLMCGFLCAKTAWEKGVKIIEFPYLNDKRCMPLRLNNVNDLDTIDTYFKNKDDNYGGYISYNAKLNAKIKYEKTEFNQTVILTNEKLKRENFLFKKFNGEVEQGYYPAYRSGTTWFKYNVGDKFSVLLLDKEGKSKTVNVVLVGDCDLSKMYYLVEGNSYPLIYSGILAIDGLNIEEYAYEPYKNTIFYTDYDRSIILNNYGSSIPQYQDIQVDNMLLVNLRSTIKDKAFYLLGLSAIAFILAILFLGGKYKHYYYLTFAILEFAFAELFLHTKYIKEFFFPFISYYYFRWFYGLVFGIVGLIAILGIIIIMFKIIKNKKINNQLEKNNDKTPKYL